MSIHSRIRDLLASAHKVWPDARGLDLALLGGALALRPFCVGLFRTLGSNGHRLRRIHRARRSVRTRKVLHVTCSFDLGGTQRQIKNICEHQDGSPFTHDAVEIFPEANFLFRRNVTIDSVRYGSRTAVGRALARLVGSTDTRSSHMFQVYKLACDFRALRPDVVVG